MGMTEHLKKFCFIARPLAIEPGYLKSCFRGEQFKKLDGNFFGSRENPDRSENRRVSSKEMRYGFLEKLQAWILQLDFFAANFLATVFLLDPN